MEFFINKLDRNHGATTLNNKYCDGLATFFGWIPKLLPEKAFKEFAKKGKQPVGRPKETWLSMIKRILMSKNTFISEIKK